MTTPLMPELSAVNAEVFLRSWLLPVVATTPVGAGVGSKLWTVGFPKPYRAVRRVAGGYSEYGDEPLMRVHTFGASYSDAGSAAGVTDDRLRVLVEYPGWSTVLPDGGVAHCDWCEVSSGASEEPYSAETVVFRFVTEVRLGLSFVPA